MMATPVRGPHRRRTFYAASFTVFGTLLLYVITTTDDWRARIFIGWCALSLIMLGIAYFLNWTSVFGKTPQGRLRLLPALVMGPFLLLTWIVWRIQNLFLESQPWSRIAPGLCVGRRCSATQLPPGTTIVIDVTAEFLTHHTVRSAYTVLCSPTLDGAAPSWEQCRDVFEAIPWSENPGVYVCCANGAGRSVTFVATFLGLLGLAHSAEEAIQIIRKERRVAGPGRDQRAFLEVVFPQLPDAESGAACDAAKQLANIETIIKDLGG
jgi:hypothetical protein